MTEFDDDMDAISWPIEMLVPHSGLMLLLDKAASQKPKHASAEVRIADDSLFCTPGVGVPAWVGIEYMAQTVAMYGGLKSVVEGREIEKGLLVGARRYQSSAEVFPVGARLIVTAEEELMHGQAGVFRCRILRDGRELLAQARLNIYVPVEQSSLSKGFAA